MDLLKQSFMTQLERTDTLKQSIISKLEESNKTIININNNNNNNVTDNSNNNNNNDSNAKKHSGSNGFQTATSCSVSSEPQNPVSQEAPSSPSSSFPLPPLPDSFRNSVLARQQSLVSFSSGLGCKLRQNVSSLVSELDQGSPGAAAGAFKQQLSHLANVSSSSLDENVASLNSFLSASASSGLSGSTRDDGNTNSTIQAHFPTGGSRNSRSATGGMGIHGYSGRDQELHDDSSDNNLFYSEVN